MGWAAAVILGAAFVQGVTGFAHGLLAIGPLILLFGPKEAVLILALVAPVISGVVFVRLFREVEWRETLIVAAPLALVGMPLGILAFQWIDPGALRGIVGVVLILSAVWFLTPFAPSPDRVRPLWGMLAGFGSGLLGGLTSTGGPPLVLYLYSRRMEKRRRMAILQAVFVISALVKVLQLLPTGLLTTAIWTRSGILAVPLVVGVFAGQAVFDRLPAEWIRRAALLLLLVNGILLVIP